MQNRHIINGTYELLRQLGHGASGTVFLAFHKNLEKNVVLKRIDATSRTLAYYRKETDILKNLKNDYIPQVMDYVVDVLPDGEERVYTVMEYIPGKSFADLLKEGRTFTPTQVAKYMGQLTSAVTYLHSQESPIIHGDIKPANIMLTPSDDICLIDFNISTSGQDMNLIGFTNHYAAPEQIAWVKTRGGKSQYTYTASQNYSSYNDETVLDEDTKSSLFKRKSTKMGTVTAQNILNVSPVVDTRVDIYGIGATMYTLLTGNKPEGSGKPNPSIAASGVKMSEGMVYLIDKAMAYNPDDRFASAREMLTAVENLAKMDSRYKNYVRGQNIKTAVLTLAVICFSALAYAGTIRLEFEKADRFYNNAYRMYRENDYRGALEYILIHGLRDESIYDRGTLANMYFIAAESSYELGEYNGAIDFYKTSLEYNPDNVQVYSNYAISLAKLSRTDEALRIINRAKDKGLSVDNIVLMEGELAAAKGDYNTAAGNFEKCIETTDNEYLLARAYMMYYSMYKDMPGYEKDKNSINNAISVLTRGRNSVSESYRPLILNGLSEAYFAMGDLTETKSFYRNAASVLKQVLDAGWNTFEVNMNLAAAYEEADNYSRALEQLNTVLNQFGENYIVYKRLAFVEVEIQSSYPVENRNYHRFVNYYEKCFRLAERAKVATDTDAELMLLKNTYNTLKTYNWL